MGGSSWNDLYTIFTKPMTWKAYLISSKLFVYFHSLKNKTIEHEIVAVEKRMNRRKQISTKSCICRRRFEISKPWNLALRKQTNSLHYKTKYKMEMWVLLLCSHLSTTPYIISPIRFKTEFCRNMAETGSCRFGGKCHFALARHPKHKSQMCCQFHSGGFCPFGVRCYFIR